MKNIIIVQTHINEQQTYIWLAYLKKAVVGHVFLTVEVGNRIKFHNAWVDKKYRKKGVYSLLWNKRWEYTKENFQGYVVYAWCKPNSIGMFENNGFSTGEHAIYVETIVV